VGFTSELESSSGAAQAEDVGGMTGLFPAGATGTRGAPADDSPYPVNR